MRETNHFVKNVMPIIITILIMCACGSASKPAITYETDSDGTRITHSDSGDSYSLESIPYNKLDYNGTFFTLRDVRFYQTYNASSYSYDLFATVEMDISALTDAEAHWLLEDKGAALAGNTLDTAIYAASEKNGLDDKRLTRVYYVRDASILKQMFYLMSSQKHDLSDLDPSLSIYIKQDATYEYKSEDGKTSKLKQTKTYYWFPDSVEVIDASEMPEEYVNAFTDYVARLTS